MELNKSNNETQLIGELPAINIEYLEAGQKPKPPIESNFNFFDFRVDTMEFDITPIGNSPLETPEETLPAEIASEYFSNPYEKHYAGQFEDYRLQVMLEALINTPSES